MKKLAKLLCLGGLLVGALSFALGPAVYADDPFCDNLTGPAATAAGCSEDADLTSVIKNILKAVIGVAGFVAVVFVVIGGIQYTTSIGDPGKIKKARDTILYALIGLIICALAFVIVDWTVGVVNNSTSGDETSESAEARSLAIDF